MRRDRIRKCEFMKQKGKFNYYTSEELRAHVLEMPYVGDEVGTSLLIIPKKDPNAKRIFFIFISQVSMVLILPPFEDLSIRETVSRLTPDTLRGVMAEVASGFYSVDELTVKVPKFKIGQRWVGVVLLHSYVSFSVCQLRSCAGSSWSPPSATLAWTPSLTRTDRISRAFWSRTPLTRYALGERTCWESLA